MTEPAYTFSLPSMEDDTTLDCRIYQPSSLAAITSNGSRGVRAAVLAHPYAPLGGCYDDHVVLSVTETLVEQGYVVATFNFRGAGGSQGKTSWSGRSETEDYISIAGFMMYYLRHLDANRQNDTSTTVPPMRTQQGKDSTKASVVPNSTVERNALHVLLGGYSYGSLILAHLPPPQLIIKRFQEAALGTAAAEIILRARTLAKQTLQTAQEAQSPTKSRGRTLKPDDSATSPTQHAKASPVTVGGEETDPSDRRRSRDSRRSVDIVRKSVEMPQRIKARIRRHSDRSRQITTPEKEPRAAPTSNERDYEAPDVRVCYLVISPVVLPFTNTLCPPGPLVPTLGARRKASNTGAGTTFLQRPTLALFGSSDSFTSGRRLCGWAEKQAQASAASGFTWKQIDGAGHFWREEGVMQALQDRITDWVASRPPSD